MEENNDLKCKNNFIHNMKTEENINIQDSHKLSQDFNFFSK